MDTKNWSAATLNMGNVTYALVHRAVISDGLVKWFNKVRFCQWFNQSINFSIIH